MKANFFNRIFKWSSTPVLILLLLFSCENQLVNEKEIQRQILQDEDFASLLSEAFILNYLNEGVTAHERNTGLMEFDSYFEILDNRYDNFCNNAQHAMLNKYSEEYGVFCEGLKESIYKRLPAESARIAVVYNGASICGRESCGDSAHDNTTLGCIAGASMAGLYCQRNNMGNCNEMRNALVDECCDSFCNPQN